MTSKLLPACIALLLIAAPAGNAILLQKPADAIDSVQSEVPGVQTDLIEVKRMSDGTVRVVWRWRNTTDRSIEFPSFHYWDDDKTFLIDPVNKKKHFVVMDAKGSAIGSAINGNTTIPAKQSLLAWVRFPAPPAAVAKITVVVSKSLPFEDVTVSR